MCAQARTDRDVHPTAPEASPRWEPGALGVLARDPAVGRRERRHGSRRRSAGGRGRQRARHLAPPSPTSRIRSGRAGIVLGLAALLVGLAAATTPVWSGRWDAAAQQAAAAGFTRPAPAATTTPPDAAGAVPAPLEALTVPAPVLPGQTLTKLVIPAIGVDAYVLEGLTFQSSVWEGLLRRGPAHLEGSALPGGPGNAVIFGHVNVWGSVFQHLDRLQPGQTVVLDSSGGAFTYTVTGSELVPPADAAALTPHGGGPTLQLVTCAGLFDAARLIVEARLTSAPAAAATNLAQAESLVAAHEAARLAVARTPPAPLWRSAWVALRGGAWRSAWRAASELVNPAARPAPPPPGSYAETAAWPLGDGRVRVMVGERGAIAGGQAERTVAYTVGPDAAADDPNPAAPHIESAVPVPFQLPVVLDASPPTTRAGWSRGAIECGQDIVRWWAGPEQPTRNNGFTFQARPATLRATRPDGLPLDGIDVPGLSMGTYPAVCGDLVGDASTALVVRTIVPPEGPGSASSEVAVYRLEEHQAVLIGQMLSEGTTAPPRLAPTHPGAPYDLLVPEGAGPDQRWVVSDGTYQQAGGGAGTTTGDAPGVGTSGLGGAGVDQTLAHDLRAGGSGGAAIADTPVVGTGPDGVGVAQTPA